MAARDADVEAVVQHLLKKQNETTPSHLYLELLRHGFRHGWELGRLDLRQVSEFVAAQGFAVHAKTGRLSG